MKRVNVNFSESAYETLCEFALKKGKSMAETLRDAITMEKWVQGAVDEGSRILIKRNGEMRELVFK